MQLFLQRRRRIKRQAKIRILLNPRSLVHEREAFSAYQVLLEMVKDRSIMLEEYARRLIAAEEMHQGEVDKMLRKPGDIESFSDS